MRTKTDKNKQKLHFIWVGGHIPLPYLVNVKDAACKGLPKFRVHLWTENENHILHTSIKEDIPLQGIKLRNINELLPGIFKDFSFSYAKQILDTLKREIVGNKNLSAVADILRCIILYQEGHLYSDIDFRFTFQTNSKGRIDWTKERLWDDPSCLRMSTYDLPYGIRILGWLSDGAVQHYDNCFIAAEAGCSVLKKSIERYMDNYKNLDLVDSRKHYGPLVALSTNEDI